jgi:hypothetical protein
VSINGEVGDNAFVFAQKTIVEGRIGGDLFIFGQNVLIRGEVGGDIYCYGGELEIAPGGSVGGNIIGGAGGMDIAGTVGGTIKGGSGSVFIDGQIAGDVDIGVGSLEVGPTARIAGNLKYHSSREALVHPDAKILGEFVFVEQVAAAEGGDVHPHDEDESGGFSPWGMIKWFWGLLAALIVGAILLALLGRYAQHPSGILGNQPGKTLGVGFLVAVVAPAAALIAIALILTLPLGLITFALYLVALYLAQIVFSLWLGDWLLGFLGKGGKLSFAALALGLLVLNLLMLVPYLGFLLKVLAAVAGLGGIFLALASRKGKPAPAPAPAG